MVLVLERQPRWGPLLRFELQGSGVAVRECRHLSSVEAILTAPDPRLAPRPVVVIDLEFDASAVVAWLVRVERVRQAPVVLIAPEELSACEWALRDLGAAAVVKETASAGEIAAICRRLESGSVDPSRAIRPL